MKGVVIQVEELDEQRVGQDQPLQPGLARHADVSLELPDPPRPAEGAIRPEGRMRVGQLPERVEAQDESGLERASSDPGEQRPARHLKSLLIKGAGATVRYEGVLRVPIDHRCPKGSSMIP